MKNILFVFFVFSLLACMGQSRVVDQSGRKPSWVNGLEKDYIIVAGTGNTAQDAQKNALNMIRENIVNAVAQNVQTTAEFSSREESINNSVSSYFQSFATTTTAASGPVPYLQGVTLSKVDDYYWEKIENRSTGSTTFNYHIKYPFPDFELQKLAMQFRMRDREMSEQLDELYNGVDEVSSLEDVAQSIEELRVLADYFVDARKDRAQMAISRYRGIYENIDLVEIESSLGELKYAVRLGDRFIHTTQRPRVSSDCARITGTSVEQEYVQINYDYQNCWEDPENHILVHYRFGNTNVREQFYFDITREKVSIFVNDPIHLSQVSQKDDMIETVRINLTVVSRYEFPFTIDRVVLQWPGHPPVSAENIGESFSGEGNHSISLEVSQPMDLEKTTSSNRRVSMLSGYINYRSDVTGETKTYRMHNQAYTTDW